MCDEQMLYCSFQNILDPLSILCNVYTVYSYIQLIVLLPKKLITIEAKTGQGQHLCF